MFKYNVLDIIYLMGHLWKGRYIYITISLHFQGSISNVYQFASNVLTRSRTRYEY